MELLFAVLSLVAVIAALYFAYEGAQLRHISNQLEGRNTDLRQRVIELTTEIQRLREASGYPMPNFPTRRLKMN